MECERHTRYAQDEHTHVSKVASPALDCLVQLYPRQHRWRRGPTAPGPIGNTWARVIHIKDITSKEAS